MKEKPPVRAPEARMKESVGYCPHSVTARETLVTVIVRPDSDPS